MGNPVVLNHKGPEIRARLLHCYDSSRSAAEGYRIGLRRMKVHCFKLLVLRIARFAASGDREDFSSDDLCDRVNVQYSALCF